MTLSGNTTLITGGTPGRGLARAKAFSTKGNDVIVCGRRDHLLQEIASQHTGIVGQWLDAADPSDSRQFAKALIAERPQLNVVVQNAGIRIIRKSTCRTSTRRRRVTGKEIL